MHLNRPTIRLIIRRFYSPAYDAASMDIQFLLFSRKCSAFFFNDKNNLLFLYISDLENEANTLSRNIGNLLTSDMTRRHKAEERDPLLYSFQISYLTRRSHLDRQDTVFNSCAFRTLQYFRDCNGDQSQALGRDLREVMSSTAV